MSVSAATAIDALRYISAFNFSGEESITVDRLSPIPIQRGIAGA
jgi:hypothetical protein